MLFLQKGLCNGFDRDKWQNTLVSFKRAILWLNLEDLLTNWSGGRGLFFSCYTVVLFYFKNQNLATRAGLWYWLEGGRKEQLKFYLMKQTFNLFIRATWLYPSLRSVGRFWSGTWLSVTRTLLLNRSYSTFVCVLPPLYLFLQACGTQWQPALYLEPRLPDSDPRSSRHAMDAGCQQSSLSVISLNE